MNFKVGDVRLLKVTGVFDKKYRVTQRNYLLYLKACLIYILLRVFFTYNQ